MSLVEVLKQAFKLYKHKGVEEFEIYILKFLVFS